MRAFACLVVVAGIFVMCSTAVAAPPVRPSSSAPLGAPGFQATPEQTVGWRGDGTGRYPGANPPTSWERKGDGTAYQTKGIVWMTPLPSTGVSSPIVVGERIFVTTEVSDLVCLDKKSGRILWIRSNPDFEGVSAADRKENPAYAEKLVPLAASLARANAAVVEVLNAQQSVAPMAGTRPLAPVIAKKREIEKQIQDEQIAIDKKRFARYWAQAVFGFAGQTPTSDGKHVCTFFTTGVTACYDLNGNRQWIRRGAGGGSEHGNFASPLLSGGRVTVWANEMRAYDVDTGKLAWTVPAKASNTYGSMFGLRSGSDLVASFQWGFFVRIRDGQLIWNQEAFGDAVVTPIVENGAIFAWTGYPKANDDNKGFKAFPIPASTESGKIEPAYTFDMKWADDELPLDKKKNPFDRSYVASPLYYDGLIYQMSQGGGLMVNDAATGELVYRKVLPLKPRTEYWNWAGASASPTLAGKYIYLMDNQGTTVVIQPGRQYKQVAENHLSESTDNKTQAQTLATPFFEGTRMYYRSPEYMYCIGAR